METNEKWQREGASIYKLHQTGWDKEKPLLTNKFYARVYPDYHVEKAEELAEKEAKKLAAVDDLIECLETLVKVSKDGYITTFEDTREGFMKWENEVAEAILNAEQAIKKATE